MLPWGTGTGCRTLPWSPAFLRSASCRRTAGSHRTARRTAQRDGSSGARGSGGRGSLVMLLLLLLLLGRVAAAAAMVTATVVATAASNNASTRPPSLHLHPTSTQLLDFPLPPPPLCADTAPWTLVTSLGQREAGSGARCISVLTCSVMELSKSEWRRTIFTRYLLHVV